MHEPCPECGDYPCHCRAAGWEWTMTTPTDKQREFLAQPRVGPTDVERLGAALANVEWEMRSAVLALAEWEYSRLMVVAQQLARVAAVITDAQRRIWKS
jgi:hypothetical protein